MGTSLDCIQVFLADRDFGVVQQKLVASIRKRVTAENYKETQDDPDPDREVYYSRHASGRWITVYDTQADNRQLAQALSKSLKTTVIFASLYDSDSIHLRRYDSGKMVDDYCDEPNHHYELDYYGDDPSDWGELTPEKIADLKGHAERWADLLVKDHTTDFLRESWDSRPVFTDDILADATEAFGMTHQEIWEVGSRGSKYFDRLTFNTNESRLYELKASGPPRLHIVGWTGLGEHNVGDHVEVYLNVRNEGGELVGLEVIAAGTALDQGLIELDDPAVGTYRDGPDFRRVAFSPISPTDVTKQSQKSFHVAFPITRLPAGVHDVYAAAMQRSINWHKVHNAISAAQINLWLPFTVVAPGEGTLNFEIFPTANPVHGKVTDQSSLKTVAPHVAPSNE